MSNWKVADATEEIIATCADSIALGTWADDATVWQLSQRFGVTPATVLFCARLALNAMREAA